MKLEDIQIGKKITVINAAIILAWLSLTVGLLSAFAFAFHIFKSGTLNYPAFIFLMVSVALTTFLVRWNAKQPTTRYAILQVLDVDPSGSTATRVRVQYRDGTEGEKRLSRPI